MNNYHVKLEGVQKSFVDGGAVIPVLKGINLTLLPGEVTGLVGESGVGKSTLLHLVGLLDDASHGTIMIDEHKTQTCSPHWRTLFRRNHIGFIHQKHCLLSEFSVIENVMLPLLIQGVDKTQAQERAYKILKDVSLSHRTHFPTNRLSGGEQQRASVARALVKRPKILLADEPTGNLDPVTGERVFDMFLDLARSAHVATLIATHNLALAQKMDRIILLKDGLIFEENHI